MYVQVTKIEITAHDIRWEGVSAEMSAKTGGLETFSLKLDGKIETDRHNKNDTAMAIREHADAIARLITDALKG